MIYNQKTQPAPVSLAIEKLKVSGSYSREDVLIQNKIDFRNKCYLCEDKEPNAINTEHFLPHRGNVNLKFDWDNLFFCCSHCNNTKLDKVKYDNILNCTVVGDAVETNIKYHLKPFPKEMVSLVHVANDIKTLNTVDLLLEIYNGTTPLKKLESSNLRTKILKEILLFQDVLLKYCDDTYTDEEKAEFKNTIIRYLRPSSSFTAFKKWIIRDNEGLMADFSSYI
jgi:hypothetical protein